MIPRHHVASRSIAVLWYQRLHRGHHNAISCLPAGKPRGCPEPPSRFRPRRGLSHVSTTRLDPTPRRAGYEGGEPCRGTEPQRPSGAGSRVLSTAEDDARTLRGRPEESPSGAVPDPARAVMAHVTSPGGGAWSGSGRGPGAGRVAPLARAPAVRTRSRARAWPARALDDHAQLPAGCSCPQPGSRRHTERRRSPGTSLGVSSASRPDAPRCGGPPTRRPPTATTRAALC